MPKHSTNLNIRSSGARAASAVPYYYRHLDMRLSAASPTQEAANASPAARGSETGRSKSNGPRCRFNPWIVFRSKMTPSTIRILQHRIALSDNPSAKVQMAEVSKVLGRIWRGMSDDEKVKYKEEANRMNEEYARLHPDSQNVAPRKKKARAVAVSPRPRATAYGACRSSSAEPSSSSSYIPAFNGVQSRAEGSCSNDFSFSHGVHGMQQLQGAEPLAASTSSHSMTQWDWSPGTQDAAYKQFNHLSVPPQALTLHPQTPQADFTEPLDTTSFSGPSLDNAQFYGYQQQMSLAVPGYLDQEWHDALAWFSPASSSANEAWTPRSESTSTWDPATAANLDAFLNSLTFQ